MRTKAGASTAYREKAKTQDEKRARKSTANRVLTVLKAILNRAFQDDLVDNDSVWRKVKPFENADEPITRFLTEAESTRLVNASDPHFRPLVKAALFTGARYGELTRIRAKDVSLDTGMVYISPEAKSGKGRYVPLSVEGQDFFASLIAGRMGAGPRVPESGRLRVGQEPSRPAAGGGLQTGQRRPAYFISRIASHLCFHSCPGRRGLADHFQAAGPCGHAHYIPALRAPVRQDAGAHRPGFVARLRPCAG